MRRAALALIGLLAAGPAAAGPRAASTTLCGDQYLLALADRSQIASVSWMAIGPHSFHADRAAGLPQNRGAIEQLVAAGADLLVTGPGTDPQTRRALARFGIDAVEIDMAPDFDGIAANLRRVATALGEPARGEAAVAAMQARLAALAPPPDAPRPRIVYYRPDGGGAGLGTIVDAALSAAGYANLQAERGMRGWGGLPAEALALDPPDGFVISYFDTGAQSVRRRLGRNPILQAAFGAKPVVAVPGDRWACAHPMVVEAVAALVAARQLFAGAAP